VSSPLLTTKLYIPPFRPELVPRPRLIERMSAGPRSGRKLTILSAPAGFGKTTLVSEWLSGVKRSSAWLSLDEGDNDLARFLTYIIASLQQIDPNLGQSTQAIFQAAPSPAVEPLLSPLINEIAALDISFTLVLDDYHAITLPAIHEAVTFVLDHMPPPPRGMHLVIATREDPPLPLLARLRVQRQMTELRAADLRFTEEEAAAFLNRTMGLDLSTEDIAAIETRTEGWIAGLQLAALSMQGEPRERIPGFIQAFSGSHRYVADYLAEEVLKRRPPRVRSFLLQTSILDRLSGPLCDAVCSEGTGGTEQENSQALLEQLEEANLFLVPLDHERRWYRYHHLFTGLLRNQLEAAQPALVPTLHRRASSWFEQKGLRSEAIAHSLAAGDVERAAQLIDKVFDERMSTGEYFSTMLAWLEELPDEIISARPRLGIWHAWMLVETLHLDAVEPRLQEIERDADGQLPAGLRLLTTVIRATLARRRDDLATAIELSHHVLEIMGENPSASSPQAYTGIVFNLAFAYLQAGDLIQAGPRMSDALTISQALSSITLTLLAMTGLAQIEVTQGQLHKAADTCRKGLQRAAEAAQQSRQAVPAAAHIHVVLGDLLREWDRLDDAERHLTQGIELGRQWQIGDSLRDGYLFRARLRQAQGDMVGGLDAIRQAEQLPQVYQTITGFAGPIAACRAKLALFEAALAAGDLADQLQAVVQWATARGLRAEGSIDSLSDEFEYLVWARLLIAQNEPSQALEVLARLMQAARDGGRTGSVIEVWVLQGLAHEALGDTEQAMAALERALLLAEPEGYIRLFVDEGRRMAELLRQAASRGVAPDYVSKLLLAIEPAAAEEQTPPAPPPSFTPAPRFIEPLTDRELEVLRLLITDLSGPEIAEQLVVSVNTVKTHIKRIYGKLDAHSRYEAIERAKELNIL